jgi:hypothetical protein
MATATVGFTSLYDYGGCIFASDLDAYLTARNSTYGFYYGGREEYRWGITCS